MLNKERTTYQQEQNQLLKTVLDLRFFNPWKETDINQYSLRNDANLEIYITAACNQNCSYCYLVKYEELYPKEFQDPELILHNLRLLYDYILENNYHIPKIEFFTGEIWHSQFGWDVLEITLEYLNKGLQADWFMIASNCSFVRNNKACARIQHYIDAFKQTGHNLTFSVSVDGKILEEKTRPLNNGYVRTDEDWDKIFSFAKHNNFCFHPMVSAASAPYWIENFQWWIQQLDEYGFDLSALMMLEVRNDDWTDEAIQAYLEYLNYEIDYYLLNYCNNDIRKFANHLFNIREGMNDNDNSISGYINYAFAQADTFMGCTVATDLTVRLGDLAICPCHRTAYNKLLYGKFVVENDKIIDIEAFNPQMAIKVLMSNVRNANYGCDTCWANQYCLQGCFGAQKEALNDPFFPIESVCKMFKAKLKFLIQKYTDMGVIAYLHTITEYELEYPLVKQFLDFVENMYATELYNMQKHRKDRQEDGMGERCPDVSTRAYKRQ